MTRAELIFLGIIVFLGYLIWRAANGMSIPGMGTLNTPVDSGGAINHSTQDAIGQLAGFPMADYSSGPNFYVQNQPWFFDPPTGGVMPMNAASTNIVGAPSAQQTPQCFNC